VTTTPERSNVATNRPWEVRLHYYDHAPDAEVATYESGRRTFDDKIDLARFLRGMRPSQCDFAEIYLNGSLVDSFVPYDEEEDSYG